jgi:DNA-nicking Smr family endonuclease
MKDDKDIDKNLHSDRSGMDEIDEQSRSLFHQAVSGSRRLHDKRVKPYRTRVKPVPRQRLIDEQAVLDESLQPLSLDVVIDSSVDSEDEVSFASSGVQQNVMRKLRRGQYRIEAELDLHRMTSEQAHNELRDFIVQCQKQHVRCVRIIHGKGLGSQNKVPVLKSRVNSWLRQWDNILAFCSARKYDGGTGALYVLLRRKS